MGFVERDCPTLLTSPLMRQVYIVLLLALFATLNPKAALAAKVGGSVSCSSAAGYEPTAMTATGLDRIAKDRTQVDVLLTRGDVDTYTVTVTDSNGSVLNTLTQSTWNVSNDQWIASVDGLPTSGDLNVTVTGIVSNNSTDAPCSSVTWTITRFSGITGVKWSKLSNSFPQDIGYALGGGVNSNTALQTMTPGLWYDDPGYSSCQELAVKSVTATVIASGGLGSQKSMVRFSDQCNLLAGHKDESAPKILGAKTSISAYGFTLTPNYKKHATETYRMKAKVGSTFVAALTRHTSFNPAYGFWEGSNAYIAYCEGGWTFWTTQVQKNGRWYCTSSAFRFN